MRDHQTLRDWALLKSLKVEVQIHYMSKEYNLGSI